MKKKILGITALLAVLAMTLTFTTCNMDVDDGIERTVTFINNTKATIAITCEGSPSSFDLIMGTQDQGTEQLVTRTGKDIRLLTITLKSPSIPDPWDYVEIDSASSAVAGKKDGKGGLNLKSGTIIFKAVSGQVNDKPNPIGWKITVIPQDE